MNVCAALVCFVVVYCACLFSFFLFCNRINYEFPFSFFMLEL